MAVASPSLAQVPSTLEPSRLQDQANPFTELKAQPRIALPATESNVAPAGTEGLTFKYASMQIDGASALRASDLSALFAHAPGDTVAVSDIFKFADAISAAYRKAGYALSFATVPQQEVTGGAFRIQVIEGFVDRVDVEGLPAGRARARIEALGAHVRASRPLRTADLERYLLLMNDLPGVQISGVLSPADVQAGALLTLRADYRPLSGQIGYDNVSSEALGRDTGEAGAEERGLLTGSDHLSVRVRRSLTSSAYQSVSGEASTMAGSDGLRLGVKGSWASSDPVDAVLDAIEYRAKSRSGSLYADYPLIRSRAQTLRLGASIGVDDYRSTILAEPFSNDRLPAAKLWLSYDGVDAARALTSLKATVTRGLDIWGAKGDSRADGVLDYATLELDAMRNQPIAPLWGGMASAQVAAHGQMMLGSGGLFSGAECAFGGWQFGRGFVSGVQTGDHCLQGSAELHWARPAQVTGLKQPMVFDLYAFTDGGIARQRNSPVPGGHSDSHAASYGLGLTVNVTPSTSALFQVTRQWTLENDADPAGTRADGHPRFVAWLRQRF